MVSNLNSEELPTIYLTLPYNSNAISTIDKTIETITRLNYPKDKLILHFIDDHATTTITDKIQHMITKDLGFQDIKFSNVPWNDTTRHIARVRNVGLQGMQHSVAEYWFSVDADVMIPVIGLKYMVKIIMEYPQLAVVYLPYAYSLRDMDKPLRTSETDIILGCTLVRREALEQIDFTLDETYPNTDDVWLDSILQKKGWHTYAIKNVRCLHLKKFDRVGHFKRYFTGRPQLDRRLMKDNIAPDSMYKRYVYYSVWWLQLITLFISLLFFGPYIWMITIGGALVLLFIGMKHHGLRFPINSLPLGLILVLGMLILWIKEAIR